MPRIFVPRKAEGDPALMPVATAATAALGEAIAPFLMAGDSFIMVYEATMQPDGVMKVKTRCNILEGK